MFSDALHQHLKQTLERERKFRSDALHQHQAKQTQNLEMIEKIAAAIGDAISPLREEMMGDRFSIRISSGWEGVPGIHLELDDDDVPF